jgi:hypothetical protein
MASAKQQKEIIDVAFELQLVQEFGTRSELR